MRTQAVTKPRDEGPSPLFCSPFTTVPVLGCSSLEESYPSLVNQSSAWAKQGDIRQGISFCLFSSLWSQGPLAMGPFHLLIRLQLLKLGSTVPNTLCKFKFPFYISVLVLFSLRMSFNRHKYLLVMNILSFCSLKIYFTFLLKDISNSKELFIDMYFSC